VRYVPDGAGEKYEKGVGPAKKWVISVFYYPRALKFLFTNRLRPNFIQQ
jgi:hypothetical protein